MNVKSVCEMLEDFAPLALQESYDNAGLLIGNPQMEITSVLLTIDITETVVNEAIQKNCNLIISHHPLIFTGLKRLIGINDVQRSVAKAIKNDIAIYAAHTNLDNISAGVSGKMAEIIGLKNVQVLKSKSNTLLKLVTYVPQLHAFEVRQALFEAGAGHIGNYDSCSYNTDGFGTFRAKESATPYVGKVDELRSEPEMRIEVILPTYNQSKVISALIQSHPYEEPAFDLIKLENNWNNVGTGIIGELETPEDPLVILHKIKSLFSVETIRHSDIPHKKIKKIAMCGGAGSAFLKDAIASGADLYLSGDFKYHEFFETDDRILIADIGHFESEQYTKDIFYEVITKKMPTFAVQFSETKTNPINYL